MVGDVVFRPVENIALNRVRRDQLAHTNWPGYQAWRNQVKRAIAKQLTLDEAHVAAVTRQDLPDGITWSHE